MKLDLGKDVKKAGMFSAKKTGFLFLVSACLAFFIGQAPLAQSKESEIYILHTNNVTGHLFPCPT